MKSALTSIMLGTVLVGCSKGAPQSVAADLEISHLRVGLVCPQGREDGGLICFETTIVPITGQGSCVYNNEPRPCTWYGFEFDYAGAQPGDEISCVVTSNHDADFGNPTGVFQENSNRHEYRLTLEDQAGRYSNPQYTIYEPNAATAGARLVDETVCSFGTRELFRFRMELQFPS